VKPHNYQKKKKGSLLFLLVVSAVSQQDKSLLLNAYFTTPLFSTCPRKMISTKSVDLALTIPVFRQMITDPQKTYMKEEFDNFRSGRFLDPEPWHQALIDTLRTFSSYSEFQTNPLLKERLNNWYVERQMKIIDAHTKRLMYGDTYIAVVVMAEGSSLDPPFGRTSSIYEQAITRGSDRFPRNDVSWMYDRLRESSLDHAQIVQECKDREQRLIADLGLAYSDKNGKTITYPADVPVHLLYDAADGNVLAYTRLRHFFPEFDQSSLAASEKQLIQVLFKSETVEAFEYKV